MEFRTIEPGELDAFYLTVTHAFSERDPHDTEADRARQEIDRTFAAVDAGRIVGGAAAFTFDTVVPGGGAVRTAGLTQVGVLPTHRRQGALRGLMSRFLEQVQERGEPMATLFAAEAAIYGRFGFARASLGMELDVYAQRAAFVPWYEPAGTTRLLTHAEALPSLATVYRAALASRPGANLLDDRDVAWVFPEKVFPDESDDERVVPFIAVHHDDDDRPDAYAIYTGKHDWPQGLPHVALKIHAMAGATHQGTADMWRYLLDVDLVSYVKTWDRPMDEPLQWLLEEPRAMRGKVFDALMARPVDVGAALAGRGYRGDGRLRIGVLDATLPVNDGVHELEVEAGRAVCERTSAEPDLSGPVNALGAVYFGGATWIELASAGMVREHRPGALGEADALFASPVAPWAPYAF